MGILVAIGCRKRTGKDTFAELLIQEIKTINKTYDIHHSSFIQSARDYVATLLPDLVAHEDERKEEYRAVIIDIVKPILEKDELAYTKHLVKFVKESNAIVVVSDLRRYSEFKYCKDELGDSMVTIKVERDLINQETSFGEGDMDDREHYDAIVLNNGTVIDLLNDAKEITNKLFN